MLAEGLYTLSRLAASVLTSAVVVIHCREANQAISAMTAAYQYSPIPARCRGSTGLRGAYP
jgi:hypothetical protein